MQTCKDCASTPGRSAALRPTWAVIVNRRSKLAGSAERDGRRVGLPIFHPGHSRTPASCGGAASTRIQSSPHSAEGWSLRLHGFGRLPYCAVRRSRTCAGIFLFHRARRSSSQSPLGSVSASGENCTRYLAPPLPTETTSLGFSGSPASKEKWGRIPRT